MLTGWDWMHAVREAVRGFQSAWGGDEETTSLIASCAVLCRGIAPYSRLFFLAMIQATCRIVGLFMLG